MLELMTKARDLGVVEAIALGKGAKAAAAAAGHARDRAIQALSAARQAEPRLLRVDVDLAGFAIDGGDPAGARVLLQRVLRSNPQHERARRMLSLLPP